MNSLEDFREVSNYGCLWHEVGHTGLNDISSCIHGALMIYVSSDDGNLDMPLVEKHYLIYITRNKDNKRTVNEVNCPITRHCARVWRGHHTLFHLLLALVLPQA